MMDSAVGGDPSIITEPVLRADRAAPSQRLTAFQDALNEGSAGWCGRLVGPPLRALGICYGAAVELRNLWYSHVPGVRYHVAAPVISIGNITTGGTGKTPLVIEVARRLVAAGRRPAVIARGYRSVAGMSDELSLIAQTVPGVWCLADPDRVRGARTALAGGDVDVIVLDDGFQHRRLHRDLDIVCIDATQPQARSAMLPRGRLREPIWNLRRAHLIVFTRADQVTSERLVELRNTVRPAAPQTPVIAAAHRPGAWQPLEASMEIPRVEELRPYLFSGIGNPGAFAATVTEICRPVGETRFRDHHAYTGEDRDELVRLARRAGANGFITTTKDAVKLRALGGTWPLPVAVLPISIDFLDEGAKMLDALLSRALNARRPADGPA